jgi:hypothetical protein
VAAFSPQAEPPIAKGHIFAGAGAFPASRPTTHF